MNLKHALCCLGVTAALCTGCGNPAQTQNAKQDQNGQTTRVGNDKDEHGCISSAGYTWSEARKDCIRLWEAGIRMHPTTGGTETLFLVFSPDSAQVELFFSEEDMHNEMLQRRALPSGEYVWNVEDDDTKNVRCEQGTWIVSQRGKPIYRQADEADRK